MLMKDPTFEGLIYLCSGKTKIPMLPHSQSYSASRRYSFLGKKAKRTHSSAILRAHRVYERSRRIDQASTQLGRIQTLVATLLTESMQRPLEAYIEERQQIEQIKLTRPPAPWEQILDTRQSGIQGRSAHVDHVLSEGTDSRAVDNSFLPGRGISTSTDLRPEGGSNQDTSPGQDPTQSVRSQLLNDSVGSSNSGSVRDETGRSPGLDTGRTSSLRMAGTHGHRDQDSPRRLPEEHGNSLHLRTTNGAGGSPQLNQEFVALGASNDPDVFYHHEAMRESDREHFLKAMEKEIIDQWDNGNFRLVPRSTVPKGKKILPGVWALRRKRDAHTGQIKKYKARWNLDGSKQVHGVDFDQTYSPTASWPSIRLLLTLSSIHNWKTRQLDFVQAFPQAEISHQQFVELPRGIEIEGVDPFTICLRGPPKCLRWKGRRQTMVPVP